MKNRWEVSSPLGSGNPWRCFITVAIGAWSTRWVCHLHHKTKNKAEQHCAELQADHVAKMETALAEARKAVQK